MEINCEWCKNLFKKKVKTRRFCSNTCASKFRMQRQNINSERNNNWKGDNIGYGGIHCWVKRYLVKPNNCSICKENKRLDLANISQKYKRDLKDWEWLCRKCHMTKDGRLKKFLSFNDARKKEYKFCKNCENKFYPKERKTIFCSRKCFFESLKNKSNFPKRYFIPEVGGEVSKVFVIPLE